MAVELSSRLSKLGSRSEANRPLIAAVLAVPVIDKILLDLGEVGFRLVS